MLRLLAAFILFLSAAGQNYKTAIDTSQLISQSQFTCLKSTASIAFVRAYKPDGQGQFDPNVIQNVQNAAKAGISTEIYMEPQPNSTKWGFDQADELHKELKKNGVNVRQIWVMVKNPSMYSSNQVNNCGFINDVLMRNRQNGYSAAIYTNINDWNAITGNWDQPGSDVSLWYWNVTGPGSFGNSAPNFGDFKAFGAWTKPTVKQYGQQSLLCSLFVNLNVYSG